MAPSDYDLFGELKESLRGTFEDDWPLTTATNEWPRRVCPVCYRAGTEALVPKGINAIERDRGYVEKW
jgi:hypothetical protein